MKKGIIYKILDNMIDKLYDAGVDVSYFPDKAKQVLVETEREILKIIK